MCRNGWQTMRSTREELGPFKLVVRDVVTIDGVRAIFDDGWGLDPSLEYTAGPRVTI